MYKQVQVTDNQPNQYLRLLQIHEVPKMLHEVHVNVLGHAGQDATIAEVKKHYCGLPIQEAVVEFIRQCANCAP
ncbi:hypothetical protein ABBQ32_005696 [Trebouxia sp. C0010 RCD-2024]